MEWFNSFLAGYVKGINGWDVLVIARYFVGIVLMGRTDRYNYIVGTQTIGSKYQFTDKTRLLETAEIIHGMGSNILKFNMGSVFSKDNYAGPNPGNYKDLADMAANEPSIYAVLGMPFYYYIIWANPLQKTEWQWRKTNDRLTDAEAEIEYRELYDLSCYLLKTYSGSGKSFYLGHWEGDWLLLAGYDRTKDPVPARVAETIKWLNIRQKAVDDARRDTPHHDVRLFHYTEVNLVQKGLRGSPCMTTDVLPHVNVDFVSYSAYDVAFDDAMPSALYEALDFIKKHLPEKEGLPDCRIFIGEFGYKGSEFAPVVQQQKSIQFAQRAVEWGCPFVLYWQLYDNEIVDGKYEGYWLIDNQGKKQPLFYALEKYYSGARKYVAERLELDGQLPDQKQFNKEAWSILTQVK